MTILFAIIACLNFIFDRGFKIIPQTIGFCDQVGVGIAPVSKKNAVKMGKSSLAQLKEGRRWKPCPFGLRK